MQIDVPPLKERSEDIPLLVDHFIAAHNHLHDREISGLSEDALALLMQHDFPGNVRELQNILDHALVLCRGGTIEVRHLPPDLTRNALRAPPEAKRGMNLRSTERALIEEALAKHGGRRALAATTLGINPSTLYRKIQRLGIAAPAHDGRGKRMGPPAR